MVSIIYATNNSTASISINSSNTINYSIYATNSGYTINHIISKITSNATLAAVHLPCLIGAHRPLWTICGLH